MIPENSTSGFSSFEPLPNELKIKILKNLDIPDLNSVRCLGRKWKTLSDDNVLWKVVANRLNYDLGKKTFKPGEVGISVRNYIFNLRRKVENMGYNRPNCIEEIFEMEQPTIENTNKLARWVKPWDIVKVYEHLKVVLNEDVREFFNKLKSLEDIENKAKEFSVWFKQNHSKLIELESLDLSGKRLSVLPPEICQLTGLKELELKNNYLSTLPTSFGQLINLKLLNLENNSLSTLLPEIGKLIKLKSLSLSDNHLFILTPEIGKLINLKFLLLNYNYLSTLPPEIGKLNKLECLILACNRLSTLPTSFGQLTELHHLDLDCNQLLTIPKEIIQLTKLMYLYLEKNKLSALPPEIIQLTNLLEITVDRKLLSTSSLSIIDSLKQSGVMISNESDSANDSDSDSANDSDSKHLSPLLKYYA